MSDIEMGELLIAVRPAAKGWMLERPFGEPLVFNSGAQAERAARLYAEGLARAGLRVVLEIVLRDGSFGARLNFPPQAADAGACEHCEAA